MIRFYLFGAVSHAPSTSVPEFCLNYCGLQYYLNPVNILPALILWLTKKYKNREDNQPSEEPAANSGKWMGLNGIMVKDLCPWY